MLIGVMSDSHDHLERLEKAIPHILRADLVVHCGDLCSPFMIRRLGEALSGIPVHVVFGNNDGDRFLMAQVARDFENIRLHGEFMQIEMEGVRLAAYHEPEVALPLARSGMYDWVFYGHDHTADHRAEGECHLLNPGELMGMNGPSTVALVDTAAEDVKFIEV
jgi:hypothetical protein